MLRPTRSTSPGVGRASGIMLRLESVQGLGRSTAISAAQRELDSAENGPTPQQPTLIVLEKDLMKSLTVVIAIAAIAGSPATAYGQVPMSFLGTWVVDAGETAARIAADPSMAPENKPGWTERWLASGAELEITDDALSVRGLEEGPITLSVTLAEDMGDGTLLAAVLPGSSRQEEMELSIELRMAAGGRLNLRIRGGNDFDLVVWERADAIAPERSALAPGDAIRYLDNLTACDPGDFRFSYPGFGTYHNSILGREGDRCRVRTEHSLIQLTCDFSTEAIALLTSEAKYEEARTGIVSGSTDSEESRRMAEECRPG
jgi:hypothetical protein